MTSHHDVAGVVDRLHALSEVVARNGISQRAAVSTFISEVADLLESQAKALSEAEDDVDRADKGMDVWMKRALAAEARLAEAMKVIEPFAKAGELFDPRDPDGYDQCIYGPAAGDEYSLQGDHLRAARAFTNAAKTQESKDA